MLSNGLNLSQWDSSHDNQITAPLTPMLAAQEKSWQVRHQSVTTMSAPEVRVGGGGEDEVNGLKSEKLKVKS